MRKNYDDLKFSDDFIFCKVLQNNKELCRELLELIINRPVGDLVELNDQRSIRLTPNNKGVRFDVYAADDTSVIYDIEMQNALRDNIAKRARYSQSLIDLDNLEEGADYRSLCRSYIIFISPKVLATIYPMNKIIFRLCCRGTAGKQLY